MEKTGREKKMSAICVITPLISAAWPAFSSAILGAATALGFSQLNKADLKETSQTNETVEIEMKNSHIISESLTREEEASFSREGITITFRKDVRGRCGILVSGEGKTKEELKAIGTEVCRKIIQDYVRSKIMNELKKKGFKLAAEEVTENKTIRLTVRKWG
ncbi:MAG: DUF1257 domain-containing protein [Candidatus Omnitrophota bacterium]